MRLLPSEVKATTPATCLISSCLPGQRTPSARTPAVGMTGPTGPPRPGLPAPPRPPPWRPPRPPVPPDVEVFWLEPWLNWAWSRRCGSSLSASLSFQRPLRSTPAGGACASFSLAQAARQITVRNTTGRIGQSYDETRLSGNRESASAGGAAGSRGRSQIVGSANPDAAFKRLEAHAQRLGPAGGLRAAGNFT